MKTINIKGKDYVPVNERLKYFRENFKGYRLLSELLSNDKGICVFKATIFNEKGEAVANGHSQEKEDDSRSMVNKTSYIENSETSAWGRALGNFGVGIDSSVASADEVATAIRIQDQSNKPREKKYKESVHAEKQTIRKEDIEGLLFDCQSIDEVTKLWWLMTKEQQEDKTIKGWFTMRKGQLQ
jgi:hypothetical protein